METNLVKKPVTRNYSRIDVIRREAFLRSLKSDRANDLLVDLIFRYPVSQKKFPAATGKVK